MKTNVIVTLQVEGTHNWPLASQIAGEEVNYLDNPHRHIFYILCKKEVSHSDRDIEFIRFKHEISDYLFHSYFDITYKLHYFGSQSCEMISKELLNKFDLEYCSVMEDNENGAEIFKN